MLPFKKRDEMEQEIHKKSVLISHSFTSVALVEDHRRSHMSKIRCFTAVSADRTVDHSKAFRTDLQAFCG